MAPQTKLQEQWNGFRGVPKSPRVTSSARSSGVLLERSTPVQSRPPPTPPASARRQNGKPIKHTPTKKADEMRMSNEVLTASASSLLTQLHQVVVQISQQMIAERRNAGQLEDHIRSLEEVVAEQDGVLEQLRKDNEAMRQEKKIGRRSYQQELPRGGVAGQQRGMPSQATTATVVTPYISAAEVDRCVCSEFARLALPFPTSAGGNVSGMSPFDDVSPTVAAVLRSLATQVLQLRQCCQTAGACKGKEHSEPRDDEQRDDNDSVSSRSGRHTASPASLNSASQHAHAAPQAFPFHESSNRADQRSHLTVQRADAILSRAISNNHCDAATKTPRGHVAASVPTRSDSSTSVDSAIYEDAATILSDIRARYGL
jgi:hypothetical protein